MKNIHRCLLVFDNHQKRRHAFNRMLANLDDLGISFQVTMSPMQIVYDKFIYDFVTTDSLDRIRGMKYHATFYDTCEYLSPDQIELIKSRTYL